MQAEAEAAEYCPMLQLEHKTAAYVSWYWPIGQLMQVEVPTSAYIERMRSRELTVEYSESNISEFT